MGSDHSRGANALAYGAEPYTGIQSEDMMAYEIGYRRQSNEKLFWELATFFNRYQNLIGSLLPPLLPSENVGKADTYRFEYNATYEVNQRWHLTGSYSFFIECVEYPSGYSSAIAEGTTPRNQFYLQSGWISGTMSRLT